MPEQTTRAEHLKWAKDRANKYLDAGDKGNAWASLVSDLNKHEGTTGHMGITLGIMQIMGGQMSTTEQYRTFIDGFN